MSIPDFSIEDLNNVTLVCGIDEVGRGPLAGPVLAACVHIPFEARTKPFISEIRDSKRLSAKKREAIAEQIKEHCAYGIGEASVQEIDDMNILRATLTAMERSYSLMRLNCDLALIDGNKSPDMSCRTQTVVKGDAKSVSIAAASILAKVTRDQIMCDLAEHYPHYGWQKNAGYGSKLHREAIFEYGPTPHHRYSFEPVKSLSKITVNS